MQGCKQFEEQVIEAALAGEVSSELTAHVQQCDHCRRALQALAPAGKGLTHLSQVDAPDPRARVWQRLERSKHRLWAPSLAAAAFVCLLVGLGLLWLHYACPPTTRPILHTSERRNVAKAPSMPVLISPKAVPTTSSQVTQKPRQQIHQYVHIRRIEKQKHVVYLPTRHKVARPALAPKEIPAEELPIIQDTEPTTITVVAPADPPAPLPYRQYVIVLTNRPGEPIEQPITQAPNHQVLMVHTIQRDESNRPMESIVPDP